MFRGTKAYGAGYRAGMSPRVVIKHPDGTKTLAEPECPYKGRFQVISRAAWYDGFHDGQMVSHQRWLGRRAA